MRQQPTIDVTLPSPLSTHSIARISTCTPRHAPATLERAHKWRRNVGWLPRGAIQTNIERGWVWRLELDGQDAGHIMTSGGFRTPHTLRHNCIDEELWRNGIGSMMVRTWLAWSALTSAHAIARVRTRADLTAQTQINLHTGFHAVAVDPPRKTTRHSVVTWERTTRHGNARPLVTEHVSLESLMAKMEDLEIG